MKIFPFSKRLMIRRECYIIIAKCSVTDKGNVNLIYREQLLVVCQVRANDDLLFYYPQILVS